MQADDGLRVAAQAHSLNSIGVKPVWRSVDNAIADGRKFVRLFLLTSLLRRIVKLTGEKKNLIFFSFARAAPRTNKAISVLFGGRAWRVGGDTLHVISFQFSRNDFLFDGWH